MSESKSGERPRVSETENKIQELYGQLFGTTDEEKRDEISNKIKQLKETPEGKADQEKHNQISDNRQFAGH